MRYFIYARKSTESDDRQTASIGDQIQEAQRVAEEMKLDVVDILQESKSAAIPGREVFNSMLQRIERGEANGIICWKLNRLARNALDEGAIKWMLQQGTIQKIVTVSEGEFKTEDNVLMASVNFGVANQFSKDLSRDVKRGKLNQAMRGEFVGVNKYGFVYTPKNKVAGKVVGGGILKLHPEHSKVVRKIFEMACNGNSVRNIADWLDENGVTKPDPERVSVGKKRLSATRWSLSSIRNILCDEAYTGTHYYNKSKTVNGKKLKTSRTDWIPVPLGIAIVTKEKFELAQKNLRIRRKAKKSNRFYLLKGMAKCGYCGYALSSGVSGNNTSYYRCGARHLDYTKPSKCPLRMIKAEILDRAVIQEITEAAYDPEAPKKYAVNQARNTQINYDVQRELAKLSTKLKRLTDLFTDGDIDKALYRQMKAAVELKIKDLETHREVTTNPDEISAQVWARSIQERLKTADDETKRQVIIGMTEEITVTNDNFNIRLVCGGEESGGGRSTDRRASNSGTHSFKLELSGRLPKRQRDHRFDLRKRLKYAPGAHDPLRDEKGELIYA